MGTVKNKNGFLCQSCYVQLFVSKPVALKLCVEFEGRSSVLAQ